MKKLMTVMILLSSGVLLFAGDLGAKGASADRNLELEEMLQYAIEDEYLALTEYQTLMEDLGVSRPFSNIAKSEMTHISMIEDLYETLDISIPNVDVSGHQIIPESVEEAAAIGVEAEIKNIAMYELFLEEDLPELVRDVFERLKAASENHLKAFQRQVSPQGRGRNR